MGEKKGFWLGLNLVPGIGGSRVRKLLDYFGDLDTAWFASEAELVAAGIGAQAAKDLVGRSRDLDLERELERVRLAGCEILTWEDESYPEGLREIASSPPLLYVRGRLDAADRCAAAVVGTRSPSEYGRAVARDLASSLACSGVTVVSGLAKGIDAIAHRGALESGGRTLAVLGSGLDVIYPPENRRLAEDIVAAGALLSDYPLGAQPEARNFPARNRIISGLALAVIVVEAGEGSGALISADFALEQGKELFAVPGSIYSRGSRGTNDLIRSGAHPLMSPDDVLEALNLDLFARHEEATRQLPEDESERKVLEFVTREPVHVDELHAHSGLPMPQLAAALAMLELKGRVRQVGGMHFVRTLEPRAGYRVD